MQLISKCQGKQRLGSKYNNMLENKRDRNKLQRFPDHMQFVIMKLLLGNILQLK